MHEKLKIYRYPLWLKALKRLQRKLGLVSKMPRIEFFGFKLRLDLNQEGISKVVFENRVREIDHCTIFGRLINEKQNALDLGANIGYYMLFTKAHMAFDGKVVCIEPDERNYDVLSKNIIENNLSKSVVSLQAAVANHDGKVSFYVANASNLNRLANESDNESTLRSVNCLTLNSIDKRFGPFDSLRMDIEGAEAQIFLENSNVFLKNMKPGSVIFFEIHPVDFIPSTDSMLEGFSNIKKAGFSEFGVVTSGAKISDKILDRLGEPSEIFKEGKFERGHYQDISFASFCEIATAIPKRIRYVYCVKH